MFRWYVVSTYSGHENKVSRNLEHRRTSMGAEHAIRRIVVPKEDVIETKDGQKVAKPRTSSRATCWSRWTRCRRPSPSCVARPA